MSKARWKIYNLLTVNGNHLNVVLLIEYGPVHLAFQSPGLNVFLSWAYGEGIPGYQGQKVLQVNGDGYMSTVSKGKKFETHVAELYRLMGHEVKQNVGILGHQIDIILTYSVPGGIKTKTAVECKYVEKGNLKKTDVMDNIHALVDLKRNDEVQQLTIVTTNGFAKDIWDTAQRNNIQLLTFRELQHQIVNVGQYLNGLIKDFETDDISKYYTDLAAQNDEKMPTELFDPVDDYVITWINDDTKNHLSILGEYGTGKTTFCRKLAHDLAVQYQNNPLKKRIPILINLRDYSKVMSVRQLITDLLINEYGLRGFDFPLFKRMNQEGLFLLIFDGFDEMAQKVIFDVAYTNFSKIAELAEPEKSKVILTCRTEFFRTHEQEKEILLDIDSRKNFDIVYLREFNDEQIKKFLQKRVPLVEGKKKKKQEWEYYYQKIQEVFDLRDLAKRPVLLELVVKYLPQLIEKGERINAATLYKTTTKEELKRRLKVGKTVIRKEDRIKLMKLLAVWMYNNEKLSVHYKDMEVLDLRAHFDLKTRTDIEYHLHDFLTCSFLNRDTGGNYRFSHRSFVDFLVACKFVDDCEKDVTDDFAQKKITYEVMQFMKNLGVNKARLYEWITSTKRGSYADTQYLGGNAISVLNELGENFADRKFDFSETVLDSANFHGGDLEGLNFSHASLRGADLSNTRLVNANFSFSDLKGAKFGKVNEIFSVCWSFDGEYLVSGDEGGTLKVWDRNFKGLTTLKGHTSYIRSVACSPDGRYVASGSWDNTVKIWDVRTFKETAALKGHTGHVFCVAYSPDGKYVASGSVDKTIKIWDVRTFKEIAVLKGHTDGIFGVAYSPDGRYVASGSWDNTVKIWDVRTFNEIAVLKGHTRCVNSVAYSPDGKYVASGSWDSVVKIWDMRTFNEIAALKEHTEEVWDIAYSPDGKYVASGSSDKTIKVWDTDTKSKTFGKCHHTIMQQINCMGMIIKGVKGLDKEKIEFLKERGAID